MMLQAIKKMYPTNPKSIAYITLNENNDLASLYKEIDKLIKKGIKYIFIDEITSVNGFIQSAARLADIYARQGVHIVIAGTDSYILELAGRDNLYDRVVKISTTYIGYKEYAYLVEGSDLLDYIHNGGTLKADAFYDVKRTNEYVDTSISNNIINSLIRANNLKEHSHLLELQGRGLLKKAIEQAIASANTELTTYVITEAYTNKDLGSAKQMMEQIFNIDSTLDTQEVEERVRYKLSIVKQFDATISNDYVEELREFLETLGVIKTYIRYVGRRKVAVPIFVQPGLRYNQTIELLNALFETQSFSIYQEALEKILLISLYPMWKVI